MPSADRQVRQGAGASTTTTSVPAPTADQSKYVSDIIKWRDSSYKPDAVIGGPNRKAPRKEK